MKVTFCMIVLFLYISCVKFLVPDSNRHDKGIYEIRCHNNNKVYIGSASSKRGLIARYWNHIEDLHRGNHHNISLQRAWDKYGDQSFSFSALEYFTNSATKKEIWAKEQEYLSSLKTPRFNFKLIAQGGSREGTSKLSDYRDLIIALRGINTSYPTIVRILKVEYSLDCHWQTVRTFYLNHCGGEYVVSKYDKWKNTIVGLRNKNYKYEDIADILSQKYGVNANYASLVNFCYSRGIYTKRIKPKKKRSVCYPHLKEIRHWIKEGHRHKDISKLLWVKYSITITPNGITHFLLKNA